MNDDLISRKELKDFIKEVCFSEKWVKFRLANGSIGQIKCILAYIDNAPTVDIDMINAMAFIKEYCKDVVDGCSNCPMFDNCVTDNKPFPYFWYIPEV